MGWHLKIELTTEAIKALWSPVLGFKWLVILLLNSALVKDCSMKLQYCLLYLKVLALIFLCKLNNSTTGSLGRCGWRCLKMSQFSFGPCSVINAYTGYSVVLMKISQ